MQKCKSAHGLVPDATKTDEVVAEVRAADAANGNMAAAVAYVERAATQHTAPP